MESTLNWSHKTRFIAPDLPLVSCVTFCKESLLSVRGQLICKMWNGPWPVYLIGLHRGGRAIMQMHIICKISISVQKNPVSWLRFPAGSCTKSDEVGDEPGNTRNDLLVWLEESPCHWSLPFPSLALLCIGFIPREYPSSRLSGWQDGCQKLWTFTPPV